MSFIYEYNLVNFPVVAGGAALLFTAGIAAPAILPALGLLGIGKILDIVMIKVHIGIGFKLGNIKYIPKSLM